MGTLTYKKWYQSKTIMIALAQGILGVVMAVSGEYANLSFLLIVKSVLDVYIRWMTDSRIISTQNR